MHCLATVSMASLFKVLYFLFVWRIAFGSDSHCKKISIVRYILTGNAKRKSAFWEIVFITGESLNFIFLGGWVKRLTIEIVETRADTNYVTQSLQF